MTNPYTQNQISLALSSSLAPRDGFVRKEAERPGYVGYIYDCYTERLYNYIKTT